MSSVALGNAFVSVFSLYPALYQSPHSPPYLVTCFDMTYTYALSACLLLAQLSACLLLLHMSATSAKTVERQVLGGVYLLLYSSYIYCIYKKMCLYIV